MSERTGSGAGSVMGLRCSGVGSGMRMMYLRSEDGVDKVGGASGGELHAQLADKDVDDLHLWLVHAAVEVVEEDLLRSC